MVSTQITRAFLFAGLVVGIGATAGAVVLVPGQGATVLPGTASSSLPTLTGGTLVASVTDTFSTSSYSGILYTAVIRETTGTLDFLYQLHDTGGPDNMHRLTTIDFTGFSTDVDYLSDPFTGFGFVAPNQAVAGFPPNPHTGDRTTADTVGFNFDNGEPNDLGLNPGDITNVIYIRTNALNYTMGNSNIIDGNIARVESFAPTTVPGPAAVIPMALGLLAGLRRRKR